jgi:hypothetical protein
VAIAPDKDPMDVFKEKKHAKNAAD